MRKSFNGLSGLVKQEMKQHVLSGDVFIFINRRSNQVKMLCWDKNGLAVYHKRLEKEPSNCRLWKRRLSLR